MRQAIDCAPGRIVRLMAPGGAQRRSARRADRIGGVCRDSAKYVTTEQTAWAALHATSRAVLRTMALCRRFLRSGIRMAAWGVGPPRGRAAGRRLQVWRAAPNLVVLRPLLRVAQGCKRFIEQRRLKVIAADIGMHPAFSQKRTIARFDNGSRRVGLHVKQLIEVDWRFHARRLQKSADPRRR